VLQPDFRFWNARFAGKTGVQSRLVISHCLTAPHSSRPTTKAPPHSSRPTTKAPPQRQHPWVNNIRGEFSPLAVSPAHMNKLALSFIYSYKQFYYTSQ
jgi:hypothetical protein